MCPLYRFILLKNIIRSVSSSDSHLCKDSSVLYVGFLLQEVFYCWRGPEKTKQKPPEDILGAQIEPMGKNFHSRLVLDGERILSLLISLLLFLQDRRTEMKGCDSISSLTQVVGQAGNLGCHGAPWALQKNQEKRERRQIKLGEGSWFLPDALLSSRCPKMGVPPVVCEHLSSQHIPQPRTELLVQNWKNLLPQSCQQSPGNEAPNLRFLHK